jgi:hypothetical protein
MGDNLKKYISLVKEKNVLNALAESHLETLKLIESIPPNHENYSYSEGKWTIKEVLIHCMDTERIFCTRALSFARGETQPSQSFDENKYATNSEANLRLLSDIKEEWNNLRGSTISLFRNFSSNKLFSKGIMPAGELTVNEIGIAISGHSLHHLFIIKERYLK